MNQVNVDLANPKVYIGQGYATRIKGVITGMLQKHDITKFITLRDSTGNLN